MTMMKKRFLSFFLSLTLIFTFSASTLAQEPVVASIFKVNDFTIEELLQMPEDQQSALGFYVLDQQPFRIEIPGSNGARFLGYIDGMWRITYTKANGLGFYMSGTTSSGDIISSLNGVHYYTNYADDRTHSISFSTRPLVPTMTIYSTVYTNEFYASGTTFDCEVSASFNVLGATNNPIYWSATNTVTIPKL